MLKEEIPKQLFRATILAFDNLLLAIFSLKGRLRVKIHFRHPKQQNLTEFQKTRDLRKFKQQSNKKKNKTQENLMQ
jgi:hypothetical protein